MALIPKFCGEPGTMIPEDACGSITFEGVDDVTINQGAGIDLLEGVKAYDKNGVEIPVIAEPSEIPKCEVGEHTVEYKAIGEEDKFAPHIFCGDNKIKAADCQISIETEDRVITIEQADPPTINGIDELDLPVGGTANLMNGVSGVDDNGNPAEVEFLGGVMSDVAEDDDIATFDTDIEAPLKSLQLTLSPHQDCTPWIGTDEDTTPYTFRAMPTQSNDYNRESLNQIVGGTVAWNQHSPITWGSGTWGGVTATNNGDGSYTLNGECTITSYLWLAQTSNGSFLPFMKPNHKLLAIIGRESDVDIRAQLILYGSPAWSKTIYQKDYDIVSVPSSFDTFRSSSWVIMFTSGNTYSDDTITPQLFDLTQMFGSTIADYIYNLEQSSAGAGIALFKKLFPAKYYEYNVGEFISVEGLESHDTVGFNQWDEEWRTGYYDSSTGEFHSYSTQLANANPIKVLPNTTYHITPVRTMGGARIVYRDGSQNLISIEMLSSSGAGSFTTPSNCEYVDFCTMSAYGGTYHDDICINISKTTGTPKNGDYVPYVKHTYALDSDLVLRGILKLDESNNLYYDGDTYASDGTVTRKYGIVDLGSLNWVMASNGRMSGVLSTAKLTPTSTTVANCFCVKYDADTPSNVYAARNDKRATLSNSAGYVWIYDSAYTDPGVFKTAMSGVYLVYELADPTTETADPYTQIQICDPDGTEAFTDYGVESGDRDVAIPVGHESTYSLVCPIYGHDEVDVVHTGKNLLNPKPYSGLGYNLAVGTSVNLTEASIEVTQNSNGFSFPVSVNWGMYDFKTAPLLSGTYRIRIQSETTYSRITVYVIKTDGTTRDVAYNMYGAGTLTTTKTVEQGEYIVVASGLSVAGTQTMINPQIELGSTATDYEPYQGRTITETLPQTVYGGTLDVVTGELVVDRKYAVIDNPSLWTVTSGTTNFRYTYSFDDRKLFSTSTEGFICSCFQVGNNENNVRWRGANDTTFGIVSTTMSLADVQAITESGSFAICYELATPQTYQLTPQQINSLLGTNNVWSDDADHVEVIFLKSIPQDDAQFNVDGVYAVDYIATDECGNQTVKTRLIYVGDAECEPLEDENGNPLQTEIGEILCYEEGLPCAVVCESAVCECVVCCD